MLQIREVLTKKDKREFISFQNRLYKDVPQYVPTLLSDEMANISEEKNPAFEFCRMRFFLCERDGETVGRVGAIINDESNRKWKENNIRITRIDFIEDIEVARALIDTVEQWAREEGLTRMVGPMGFCDLDKEGMLIEGFEHKSMFITYYNFPYYPKFFEELGFQKEVDWVETKVYVKCKNEEKLSHLCNRVMERNKLRYVTYSSASKIKPYLNEIFDLLSNEFSDLYGYVSITQKQKAYYAGQFLMLLNWKFVGVIFNEQNEIIGIGVLAPSLADAVKKNKGRLFPFGFIPVLQAKANPKVLDMYFVAVKRAYRNLGVPTVLMHHLTKAAAENGVLYAETGPELELNTAVQSMWAAYEHEYAFKRRRCWFRDIES